MRRTTAIVGVGVCTALGACTESTLPKDRVCTTEARPSVSVLVRDAVSGTTITPGSTVHVLDGAFVDSIVVPSDWNPLFRVTPWDTYERPGTYTVRGRKAGYAEASLSGIRVTADECHVKTVAVDLLLRPVP